MATQASSSSKRERIQSNKKKDPVKVPIEQYQHSDKKRKNNPHVGLVNIETDTSSGKTKYSFDPHLEPALTWAGKDERTSFEVPLVSLHVHERVDPRTIIEAVRKTNSINYEQLSLFKNLDIKTTPDQDIEFYEHERNWSNRLIAGDSLVVMNSLIQKEGMSGKFQMLYVDPPYGIKYGSNFQPFTNKRDVKDGKDEDLNQEPEMLKAFRDTWELGVHSYLSYLRERLLLAHELLNDTGSVFIQIGEENAHYVRSVAAEIFGSKNFVSNIYFKTTGGFDSGTLSRVGDYLIWFAKDIKQLKYNQLYDLKQNMETGDKAYKYLELEDGARRPMTKEERSGEHPIPNGAKIYRLGDMCGQGAPSEPTPFDFQGNTYYPTKNSHWKPSYPKGINRLNLANRIEKIGKGLGYVRFLNDKPVTPINNSWMDTGHAGFASDKKYVVETNPKVVERCLLMTTDPGDLTLDITCGSGTTPFVAEKWGRRWIAVDTSRISVTLSKQRLMTSWFNYYSLAQESVGVGAGFQYESVPHIKMSTISNNEEIDEIFKKYEKDLTSSLSKLNKSLKNKWKIHDVPNEADKSWSKEAKQLYSNFSKILSVFRKEISGSIDKRSDQITLVDRPKSDTKKIRVTGPFTVEAVPAPIVYPMGEKLKQGSIVDISIGRSGESARQANWRDELLKSGVRAKKQKKLEFLRVEPIPGCRWLHAEAETNEKEPKRIFISFGPEHSPLEQKQVELTLKEVKQFKFKPDIVLFAAFQFDAEAAKDIDESTESFEVLKVQMNSDLFTEDLKKKRASNESFWLIGQPDVDVEELEADDGEIFYRVSVAGFDYYNPVNGKIESGSDANIAMWMLDTDYDDRSLYARQVFFPMSGKKDGWNKLAKTLKSEVDMKLIEHYGGCKSLPFKPGKHQKIAVKIIDDRGIESLRIIDL